MAPLYNKSKRSVSRLKQSSVRYRTRYLWKIVQVYGNRISIYILRPLNRVNHASKPCEWNSRTGCGTRDHSLQEHAWKIMWCSNMDLNRCITPKINIFYCKFGPKYFLITLFLMWKHLRGAWKIFVGRVNFFKLYRFLEPIFCYITLSRRTPKAHKVTWVREKEEKRQSKKYGGAGVRQNNKLKRCRRGREK